ncbi:MAG: AMP-binding protein [Planctomycetes bacterium]|nr:AMP-binding protein [Planctomycetota bacterium]
MNFYRLSPEEQRAESFARLRRYLSDYIGRYHPFYRALWKKNGVDPRDIRTYDDFRRAVPVVEKKEYRADPRAFILQPRFPGRESLYDTAPISRGALLRYAWQSLVNSPPDFVPLYRRMPWLSGRVARRAGLEWMPIHFHASTGTTGDPTPATYTWHDVHRVLPELGSQVFLSPDHPEPGAARVEFTSRCMNSFPGVPHLAFFQAVLSKVAVGLSTFDNGGGAVMSTERQIELFQKQGFHSIAVIPSYFVTWLQKAVEMRRAGRIGDLSEFRLVALGGEPISADLRRYFHEQMRAIGAHPGVKVIESLGMTEMKWAFLECDEGTGIHLNPRYFFWEVLDKETKEPVAPGREGVLTFSHVGWRGTAFVRYWTGDLARGGVVEGACPKCGYTFPRLFGPIMRAAKDFTKLKGTRVALLDLIASVRDTPGVRAFQIVMEDEDPALEFSRNILTLRVAPEPGLDRDALADGLRDRVKRATEVTPDRVHWVEDQKALEAELFARTGIKAEYVVDRRKVHV